MFGRRHQYLMDMDAEAFNRYGQLLREALPRAYRHNDVDRQELIVNELAIWNTCSALRGEQLSLVPKEH